MNEEELKKMLIEEEEERLTRLNDLMESCSRVIAEALKNISSSLSKATDLAKKHPRYMSVSDIRLQLSFISMDLKTAESSVGNVESVLSMVEDSECVLAKLQNGGEK